MEQQDTTIVIVGGGFGGIKTALDLDRAALSHVRVILIHNKSHFEYYSALYRIVAGGSPLEVCVPLEEIFSETNVEVVEDTVTNIDPEEKIIFGGSGSSYRYDHAVLALGSETHYFNIPGLEKYSLSFKSIHDALRLKQHIHQIVDQKKNSPASEKAQTCKIVIVGGGATGIETAGELAAYVKKLAKKHKIPQGLITIDLIEAQDRLLPMLPEDISRHAEKKLRKLGVNILLNHTVIKQDLDELHLKTMSMRTRTVIWTAGIKINSFYDMLSNLKRDARGAVVVDDRLRAKGYENIFVIGDAAATKYSGMAQTAVNDGAFVARILTYKVLDAPNETLPSYEPKEPVYAVPVGPKDAVILWKKYRFSGRIGWMIRRVADLRYFLSILPFRKAWQAFRERGVVCETCSTCRASNEPATVSDVAFHKAAENISNYQ